MVALISFNKNRPSPLDKLESAQVRKVLKKSSAKKVNALVKDLLEKPYQSKWWKPSNAYLINAVSLQAFLDKQLSSNQLITCSLITELFKQFYSDYEGFLLSDHRVGSYSGEIQNSVQIKSRLTCISCNLRSESFNRILNCFIDRFVEMSYPFEGNDELTELKCTIRNELLKRLEGDIFPRSEKYLFRCTIPEYQQGCCGKSKEKINLANLPPMIKKLEQIFPFFIYENVNDEIQITFPSFSIMQAFVLIANPSEHRIKAQVVYGKLKPQDIRSYLIDGLVPINLDLDPRFKLPKEADKLFAGRFGVLLHDLYHWWIKSGFQDQDIAEIKKIFNYIRSLRKSSADKKIVGREVDGKETRMGRLMWNFSDLDSAVPNYSKKVKFGFYLNKFFRARIDDENYLYNFISRLVEDSIVGADNFQEKFQISPDDLTTCQRDYYFEELIRLKNELKVV